MTDILDILKNTRELISKGWCQFALAVDSNFNVVDYNNSTATSYCLIGALEKSIFRDKYSKSNTDNHKYFTKVYNILLKYIDGPHFTLSTWNDSRDRTQQQVLDMLDNAIRDLEKNDSENKVEIT